jgi:2-keto-3-deoxy-6-phosphogluconate aldolase
LRAVFPSLEFLATGGVDATNIQRWLNAGAVAVGVGGALASADDPAVADDDWCNGVRDHLKALIEPTETEAMS